MKTIIANFKSNKNLNEYEQWVTLFTQGLRTPSGQPCTIILCPSYPALFKLSTLPTGKNIFLGVQDISPFPAGAYTGAVGTKNLEDTTVSYAIVGHSERRRYFHESDQDVANKVAEAISAGITPIVCVTREQISSQANAIESQYRSQVMVAFEPLEHIGTGETDTLEKILAVKQDIFDAFGTIPYIYGGSVDIHTDREILTHPDIDGFLVGSGCLDAQKFIDLVQKVS